MSNYGNGSIKEILTAEGKHYTPKKWRIMASYTDDNGKRQRPSKIIYGNKTDAQKALNQLIKDIQNGVDVVKGSIKFEQFANDWLKKKKASGLKLQTLDGYERAINKALPFIGNKPLNKITTNDLENMFLAFYTSTANGSMAKYYLSPIKQIFKSAYRLDLIAINPIDKAELPKPKKNEKVILDTKEAVRLNSVLMTEYKALIEKCDVTSVQYSSRLLGAYISLNTGLRRGEVLALSWGDITLGFNNGVEFGSISVSKSMTRYGISNSAKTEAGKREVSIDSVTASLLIEFKAVQAKSMNDLGLKQDNKTLLVTIDTFKEFSQTAYSAWFNRFIKKHNFTEGVSFHSLRHTHATLLVSSGLDIKTIQTRLGHANASITLNTYAHALPEKDKQASDIVSSILNSKPAEKEHRVIKFA